MDRTVMPCGTVVTTITAVKSKPGRPLPPGLSIGTKTQTERGHSTDGTEPHSEKPFVPLLEYKTLMEVSVDSGA